MPATIVIRCRAAASIHARVLGPSGSISANSKASSRVSKTYPELHNSGSTTRLAPASAASSIIVILRATLRDFSPTCGSICTQATRMGLSALVIRSASVVVLDPQLADASIFDHRLGRRIELDEVRHFQMRCESGFVLVDLVEKHAIRFAGERQHVEAIAARFDGARLLRVLQHQRHEVGHAARMKLE